MDIKLLLLFMLVYAVNTNRIGYVSEAGAGGEDGWFEPTDEDGSFSGSGGISEKIDDANSNSGNDTMTFENDNIKQEHVRDTLRVNNSMLDEDNGKSQMKPFVSTKSHLGETEKILRSVSMEAWLILGFFGIIAIGIIVIFCCLLSIKWRMWLMAKQMRSKDDVMMIKKRLSIVEAKEENTPFIRSSNLPLTNSVRKMSSYKKHSKRTVVVNDGEANANIDIVADVVNPTCNLPVDTDDHVLHGDDSSVPPASTATPPDGPHFNEARDGDEDVFKEFI